MPGTQRTRAILETWFETGDKPTQQQFYDLIASCLNFQDDTSITNRILQIEKLTSKSADFQSNILTGNQKLISIDFEVTVGTPTIKVGSSNGAGDIVWEQTISADTTNETPNYYSAAQTLWFAISGGTVNINIVYFNNYF